MASILYGRKLKKLSGENLVRCLLCANVVNEPHYLSCKDVYCRDCLSSHSAVLQVENPVCPLCAQQNFISAPGIPSGNRCKLLGNRSIIEGDWGHCNICHSQKAVGHCVCCSVVPALCKECVKLHETNGHHFVNAATTINVKCVEQRHSSCEISAYCENCDLPCCRECSAKDHQGHTITDLDSVIAKRVQSIRKIQEELKNEILKSEVVVQQLTKAFKIKVTDMKKLMEDMSAHIASIIDCLKRNEVELKRQCENICKAAENLKEYKVTYTKYTARRMLRLVGLINELSSPGQKFPLCLHFNDICRYSKQLLLHNSKISSENVKPLTVRHIFQTNNFPNKIGKLVEDLQPGTLPSVKIGFKDSSMSDVKEEVLTKPVRMWSSFLHKPDKNSSMPFGVCFPSYMEKECIVAQYESSSLLAVRDYSAKYNFHEIKLNKFSPRNVSQIADDKPHIAVTDNYDMQIKIIDLSVVSGQKFTPLTINYKFVNPSGLAILQGSQDFIVSDIHQGTISRLTSEGRLLWSVGSAVKDGGHNMADFITVDKNNRIVVSDRKENHIKLLDCDGRFLSQFGSDPVLNSPAGVCTDRFNNILIADSANHRILMFSSCGRLIQEVLKVDWPRGIALSRDEKYLAITSFDGNLYMYKVNR